MKKYIVASGVLVLLVVLPAVSWYYLQNGLNYRRAALKELSPKGLFTSSVLGEEIKHKTSLFQLEQDIETSQKLQEQFGEQETFSLWAPTQGTKSNQWSNLSDSLVNHVKEKYPEAVFLLLDTATQVRHVYQGEIYDVIKDVVAHTAIVLPRKKQKDIKMKSNGK